MDTVDVRLLGTFTVIVDGEAIADGAFPQRRAADLVKLLALAPGHRLPRDVVVESLWPHLAAEAGLANLHKAAHHARRALGASGAITLRRGVVELAPEATVTTDVARFEAGDDSAYAGELLPDDRYEEWTVVTRERLRERRQDLLRRTGRWAEVLAEDPADEEAHRELMRAHVARGDVAAAARQYRVLREELARLALRPSAESVALNAELCAGPPVQAAPAHDVPIIGREDELAAGHRALDAAGEGRGGALVVLGDAGIGKSRFADALLAAAARRDHHVLRATARAAEGRTPYRPLAEALEPLLAERPDLAAALPERTQRVLALLSPAAATPAAGSARGQEVLTALAGVLTAAARERGTVLALEDLHVADEATLRVLSYLVPVARRERLLIVLTARPAECDGALDALRRALHEQRTGVEVVLGPLEPARLRRLIAAAARRPLRDHALDAVVEAAAGNPFFAEELAAAVDADGAVRVPERLQDLLDARVRGFEDAAPEVSALFAVLDDGCDVEEIAELAGAAPEAVREGLDAGRRAGVLDCVGGRWRFRHPLLRDAARGRLSPTRLRRAHGDVADRLARAGAAPERVAVHLLACGREPEAVPLLRDAAARAAQLGAYADGEQWVELGLRHAGPDQRPALLELLGDLRQGLGDPRASGAYASARAESEPGRLPALRLKEARAHLALGDLPAAEAAIDGLEPGEGLGDLFFVRGAIAWHRGDYAVAQDQADAAHARADAGDAGAGAAVYSLEAMVAHAEGRWERAMAARLAEVWQTPQLAGQVLDAYLCVTEYVLHAGGAPDRLMDFACELHEQAEAAGARRGLAFAATVLGEAHLLSGNVEVARRHLVKAARMSREVGAVGGESLARARLGEALTILGERAEARAQIEEAIELGQVSSLSHHLDYLTHAPLLRVPEDPDEALLLVDRAEALLDPCPVCRFCPVEYHVSAAIVCARAGETARGRGFLERAEASAALWTGSPRAAAVAEARGTLLLAEGEPAEAEVAFLRAAEGYGAVGHRLHEERVREALALARV